MNENEVGTIIVEEAIRMHQALGPGLLESVYESILARQLTRRGLVVDRQLVIPVVFDGEVYEEGYRADLVVECKVIIELKFVEKTNNAHKKQLLTFLKLSGMKLGYLLNFEKALMKSGITRIVNGLE